MSKNYKLQLLDTTLRDGSYAYNFQFTANDTRNIVKALDEAGFQWIEIGHGVGLNANEKCKEKAVESDKEYLKAAAKSVKRAKFGMFCIPGIARLDDVDLAADYGAGFIRIGTNVTEVENSEQFIKRAKKHKMFVAANFMKSYAMSPSGFAKKVLLSEAYGADIVYIVDSAGGMLPKEMEEYFYAIRKVSSIPIGYHGHNNLGLAIGNSLRAVELGASIVDVSLQGFGRSAGNAPTELMLPALLRMGINLGIDPIKVMDISEEFILPLISRKGISSIDAIMGYAQFHSSFMGTIRHFAVRYQVDPRLLIIEVCKNDKINAPAILVEKLAKRLAQKRRSKIYPMKFRMDLYYGDEQNELPSRFGSK